MAFGYNNVINWKIEVEQSSIYLPGFIKEALRSKLHIYSKKKESQSYICLSFSLVVALPIYLAVMSMSCKNLIHKIIFHKYSERSQYLETL